MLLLALLLSAPPSGLVREDAFALPQPAEVMATITAGCAGCSWGAKGREAAVLVLEGRTRRRARYHRTTPGTARQARRVRLGRWRWAALAFCSAVVGLFLAVPLAVLVYWSARGFALGRGIDIAWQAALNSVLASGLAAGAAVLAAFNASWQARLSR